MDIRKAALIEGEDITDKNAIVDLSDNIPFKIGIMERKRKHFDDRKLFRLSLFSKDGNKVLKTKYELERERAEKAEKERQAERERRIQLEKELDEMKKKLGNS
ncbi:MAG: hypothetical protein ACTSVI_07070 [Promethearchaeota archaeon]